MRGSLRAQMGEITTADAARFFEEWNAMDPQTDFIVTPTVYELVARKL